MHIEQMTVGPMDVFCYIISCEKTGQAVVIDPGGDADRILQYVKANGLDVRYIIHTHCHPDHTCGSGRLKEATGASIVMHEEDEALLHDAAAATFFAGLGLGTAPPADMLVRDNDHLAFGSQTMTVLHTPGHSPGGICLYCAGHLFTGDSLFVGAAGRVDVPGGDFNTLIRSLGEKVGVLPEETVIWPGHDYGDTPQSTVGAEKKHNPYLGGEW